MCYDNSFSQWTNLAGLRRAKICQLISLHLYKENMMDMMNYIILFDRYDIPKSLNSATRHLWFGGSYPVAYHSTDTTKFQMLH